MSLIKATNSPEFIDEVSTRFVKVVISTHLLASGFQFIRIVDQGEDNDGLYLLYKDVVIEADSFWVGYKVFDESTSKINLNKPLWVQFKKTGKNASTKIELVGITPLVEIEAVKSFSDIEVNVSVEDNDVEIIKRCLFKVSKNICEFYSKSRSSSYIKVISQFVSFDFDFEKNDTKTSNESLFDLGEIALRTRYTPVLFSVGGGEVEGVSVFIDNMKVGAEGFGVWYCAPLLNGRLQAREGFLAAALSKKSLNVNSVLSDEISPLTFKHNIHEDLLTEPDFSVITGLKEWFGKSLKQLKVKNFDVESEVGHIFSKIEKHRDLFLDSVLKQISFITLEKYEQDQILTIDQDILGVAAQPLEIASEVVLNEKPLIKGLPDSLEKDMRGEEEITYRENALTQEFVEDFNFSMNGDEVTFSSELLLCKVSVSLSDVKNKSNQVFNNLLKLRVDPFVVLQMFKENKVLFNQYSYADLKERLMKSSEDDLRFYVGFENYFVAVCSEQNRRKKLKMNIVCN